MKLNNNSDANQVIQTAKSQLPALLTDFEKYYVMYHKNPEVDEFHNFFNNIKDQISTLNNTLHKTQLSLEKQIVQLEREMSNTTNRVEGERINYGKTVKNKTQLTNADNGAEQMAIDAQQQYDTQYRENVKIIVKLLLVTGLLVKCIKDSK